MLKMLLPFFLFVLLSTSFNAQETKYFTQSIYFDVDSSNLDTKARLALDELIVDLLENHDFDLRIEAFTDDQGSSSYNNVLAEKRAASTTAYLLKSNIKPRSQTVKSFGESRQKLADDLEEMRRINRRVDILITSYYFSDLVSLVDRLQGDEKSEIFRFEVSADEQIFTSASGTQVVIPENAFVYEDGSDPTGIVEFKLKEYFNEVDWFLKGLTTETVDGQLLSTAGMVYTEASASGRQLKLRAGKTITIAVKSDGKPDDEMQLFYGEDHADQLGNKERLLWRVADGNEMRRTLKRKGGNLGIRFPDEVVDFLKKQHFDVPEKPIKPSFGDVLTYPLEPDIGEKPKFYKKEPKREDFVFKAHGIFDELKPGRKRRQIEQEKFEKSLANYKRSKAKFEKRLEKYQKEFATHSEQLKKYKEKYHEWVLEMKQRVSVSASFDNELEAYRSVKALNSICKKADKVKISCKMGMPKSLYNIINQLVRKILNRIGDFNPAFSAAQKSIQFPRSLSKQAVEDVRLEIRQYYNKQRNEYKIRYLLFDCPEFDKYREILKEKIYAECIQNGNTEVMQGYVFDVNRLGWCNVDRIQSLLPNERLLAIEVREPDEAMVMVMLSTINSAVTMVPLKNGNYRTRLGLPVGIEATIVAMKVTNGRTQLAISDFVVGKSDVALDYHYVPFAELGKKLKRLNG